MELVPVFKQIKRHRLTAFKDPSLNIFSVPLDFEETTIKENIQHILLKSEFYLTTVVSQGNSGNYLTFISEVGGFEYFDVFDGKSFYSIYE